MSNQDNIYDDSLQPPSYYDKIQQINKYIEGNEKQRAQDKAKQLLSNKPKDPNLHVLVSHIQTKIGKYSQALKYIQKAQQLHVGKKLDLQFQKGIILYRMAKNSQDYDKCLKIFNQLIQEQIDKGKNYYYKGCCYFGKKNYKKSQQNYQLSIQSYKKQSNKNKQLAQAYNGLGISQMSLKKKQQSIQNFHCSIHYNQSQPQYYNNLALAYNNIKDQVNAKKYMDKMGDILGKKKLSENFKYLFNKSIIEFKYDKINQSFNNLTLSYEIYHSNVYQNLQSTFEEIFLTFQSAYHIFIIYQYYYQLYNICYENDNKNYDNLIEIKRKILEIVMDSKYENKSIIRSKKQDIETILKDDVQKLKNKIQKYIDYKKIQNKYAMIMIEVDKYQKQKLLCHIYHQFDLKQYGLKFYQGTKPIQAGHTGGFQYISMYCCELEIKEKFQNNKSYHGKWADIIKTIRSLIISYLYIVKIYYSINNDKKNIKNNFWVIVNHFSYLLSNITEIKEIGLYFHAINLIMLIYESRLNNIKQYLQEISNKCDKFGQIWIYTDKNMKKITTSNELNKNIKNNFQMYLKDIKNQQGKKIQNKRIIQKDIVKKLFIHIKDQKEIKNIVLICQTVAMTFLLLLKQELYSYQEMNKFMCQKEPNIIVVPENKPNLCDMSDCAII